jgi:hypothetical protein
LIAGGSLIASFLSRLAAQVIEQREKKKSKEVAMMKTKRPLIHSVLELVGAMWVSVAVRILVP